MPEIAGQKCNDPARADLLCFLVMAQLIARSRTGEWLRTDHLVESTRIWLTNNGIETNWAERVHLGALSQRLAVHVAEQPPFADLESLAKLFIDGWSLDYRSLVVQAMYDQCVNRLLR